MKKILCSVFATFKVLSNKIHVLHTSMKGDEFLSYHPFLGEVYEYLEGQIDPIMEDMEQFKEEVPVSLAYLIDESAVSELETCEGDIEKIMKIVAEDLNITIKLLQDGIVKGGERADYVIQNNLIDQQKQLRLFEWKNRRMMGKK